MANTHLDCLFVLKALLAPNLEIVNLNSLDSDELKKLGVAWEKIIHDAQKTPEGRARIALAITIGQWPAWGGRGRAPVPKPNPNDVKALQESIYHSLAMLIPNERTIGPTMLELAGRGQLRWNTGIDYEKSFQNGNAYYVKAVESLYQDAPINLEKDLQKINAFPRITADASAIKYWSSPGRTHLGKPKVPLLRIHTIGDGLVYSSMAQGYEDLVEKNGYSKLFRSAYVDSWGHCTFSVAEWLAAIKTVEQRIETGTWPSTKPDAFNRRCLSIDPKDKARFFEFDGVQKYNRTWVPSVIDYLGETAE
ncbi:UNVERIFIED_CONTAM: hypothetical protein GTU68_001170 [Idotea baltica]|nr:hypothetical protein [Idotea baltica]